MIRKTGCFLGASLLWVTATSTGLAESVPEYLEITDITVNGGGCTPGKVDKSIADDKRSFTLRFYDYTAEAGPALNPSDGRKACQLTINLRIPPGWRFSVASFDYRGFLKLDQGISAEHKTSYYFQGTEKTGEFSSGKNGPDKNPFRFQQQVTVADSVWSPCDNKRALNIKTAIRVWNIDRNKYPHASGVMGTDSIDGQLHNQEWRMQWAHCP